MSVDYVEKLTVEIEQDCISSMSSLSEHALAKAKAVLSGLTASSSKFKQTLHQGLEELFDRTLQPKLLPLLQMSYAEIKYVLTDEEYAEQEAVNSFVHKFMSGLDTLIEPFKVRIDFVVPTVLVISSRSSLIASLSNRGLPFNI